MTRDQLISNWNIIEAFKNGEDVQCFDGKHWYDVVDTNFDEFNCGYRIKPKQTYIPFDFSDAHKLIGMTVKSNLDSSLSIIIGVNNDCVVIPLSGQRSFEYLIEQFTFLDGLPCGKIPQ